MAERSKFQFQLLDLFWAMSLIGVGAALGAACPRLRAKYIYELTAAAPFSDGPLWIWAASIVASLFGSGICAGAGVGWLFRKPLWGAIGGAIAAAGVAVLCRALDVELLPIYWR